MLPISLLRNLSGFAVRSYPATGPSATGLRPLFVICALLGLSLPIVSTAVALRDLLLEKVGGGALKSSIQAPCLCYSALEIHQYLVEERYL